MKTRFLHDGVLGLAVGDALGVPVEFRERKQVQANPVTDMRAYGTHHQPAGSWSDDTSMTLAAADSLKQGVDMDDIMARFLRWYKHDEYTACGKLFDMGISTRYALEKYLNGTPALLCGGADEYDNGNGSLMRILPAVVYARENMADRPLEEQLELVDQVCRLTHRHMRSIIGCEIYAFLVWAIMENPSRDAIAAGLENAKQYFSSPEGSDPEFAAYARLFDPGFAALPEDAVKSTGYIVYTLEAALWSFLNTDNFRDCALKAVNLGNDTDTVTAVACSFAAMIYGVEDIPARWLEVLKNRELIEKICG